MVFDGDGGETVPVRLALVGWVLEKKSFVFSFFLVVSQVS